MVKCKIEWRCPILKVIKGFQRMISENKRYDLLPTMFEAVRHLEDDEQLQDKLDYLSFIKKQSVSAIKSSDDADKKREFFQLIDNCMLLEAPHLFESYLIYMERKRPFDKKFYLPRRETLKILVQDYQDLADGKIDFLGISMPPRTGKLVADYEPVLTSNGWKNHGDLVKGDYVYNHEGDKVKVTHVFDKGVATHRVTFSDKTTVDVHENHEWLVDSRWSRKQEVLETKEMMERIQYINPNNGKRRYMYQLPHKTPIKGDVKELHVDPYTLGARLGDGPKHIPEEYLTASVEQRLELLAGLIDTDGTFREKENRYTFVTSEPTLRDSFEQLVSTFGWRVGRVQYEPELSTSGIQGTLPYWAISFNPTMQIPCRLERKRNYEFSKPRKVSITNIEPIEETPGNCIEVEGGIYLVGRNMLPTHNSTLGIFYITWQMGRFPDRPNLMSGHSSPLTQGFYEESLSLIGGHEYTWGEIFPNTTYHKSAKYTTIDINKTKRFATLTCRSVEGTLTGATEADNCLYTDDLVKDLEESLNPERMENKFEAYVSQLMDRTTDNAHQVMVGTRWSEDDPLGRMYELYKDNPRYRFRVIPALYYDENGEPHSNFDYKVKGFSTDYYLHQKKVNDDNTFQAKYQGAPYSREGILFDPEELNYYDGSEFEIDKSDKSYSVTDVAWGGGDDLVTVIGIERDDRVYIQDVYVSKEDKYITRPGVIGLLKKYEPLENEFEANNGGHEYADKVEEELRKLGVKLNIESDVTPPTKAKVTRIIQYAPDIKDFYFRNDKKRGNMYDYFMEVLCRYSPVAKGIKDDVPDALAMLAERLENQTSGVLSAFKRTWW